MLAWLVRAALAAVFVTFAIYVSGLRPTDVDVSAVTELWHLSAREYAEEAGRAVGWRWVSELSTGSTLVFASLVLFPAGAMLIDGIASILYFRNRVPAYGVITLLQFLVLLVGASGVLARG